MDAGTTAADSGPSQGSPLSERGQPEVSLTHTVA